MQNVIKHYLFGFLATSGLVLFAHCCAKEANIFYDFSPKVIAWIEIFGWILGATSLYQLGWNIQSWGGKTQQEKLNQVLFKFFSIIGFFITVFTYFLKNIN